MPALDTALQVVATIDRAALAPDVAAYIGLLEDTVVGAARLVWGQALTAGEHDDLAETIHRVAGELTAAVPRLAGTYHPGA